MKPKLFKTWNTSFSRCCQTDTEDMVNRHKLKLIETANIDKIAILNSIPTAEGAIQIAMEKLPNHYS